MQIGANATVSCSLGTNCIFIPGCVLIDVIIVIVVLLCRKWVLSPGTTDLEIVHPYVYSMFSKGFAQ